MNIEDLQVYKISMELGEEIYRIVITWDNIDKYSIGTQILRSADSIAANISEGYGRFHYKENKLFCYYARGSLHETKTWLQKAANRNLIEQTKMNSLLDSLNILSKKLNAYINSIGKHN